MVTIIDAICLVNSIVILDCQKKFFCEIVRGRTDYGTLLFQIIRILSHEN